MTAQPAAFLITHADDPDNPAVLRGGDFDATFIRTAKVDALYRRSDLAPVRLPLIDQDDRLQGFHEVCDDHYRLVRVFVDDNGILWHPASAVEFSALSGATVNTSQKYDAERHRATRLEQILRNVIDGHLTKANASKMLTEIHYVPNG